MFTEKVIIVEGLSDKKRIQPIIDERVDIICTNGTVGVTKLDELVEQLDSIDIYILFDADSSGEKLRKQFKKEFPLAHHLYIDRVYKEVAAAPHSHLASILMGAHFQVHTEFVKKG